MEWNTVPAARWNDPGSVKLQAQILKRNDTAKINSVAVVSALIISGSRRKGSVDLRGRKIYAFLLLHV